MPDTPAAASADRPIGRASLLASGVAAIRVAIIGGVSVAMLEWAVAAWSVSQRLEGELPVRLFAAAAGRACLTHVLFWSVALIPVALLHWAARRTRPDASPDAFLVAAFVALAAAIILPIDLELVGRRSVILKSLAVAGGLVLAVLSFVVTRAVIRRLGVRAYRRIANVKTVVLGALGAAATIAFVSSPFFDPAGYRVSTEGAPTRPRPASPHVLWIVLDTVRADRLGCYGYTDDTTPFLDEWATRSTVFERAVANAIWTVPSHASMFTGKSVREHGVDFDHLRLSDEQTTAAAELQSAGYRTASFSNNPWISRETHLARGFGHCQMMRHAPRLARFSLEYLCERTGITPFVPWLDSDMGAAITNVEVDRWLSGHAGADDPVFVFVNYMDAHSPYAVPRRYREMFMTPQQVDRSYDLRWGVHGYIVPALSVRFNVEGRDFLAESDREVLRLQYDAAIRYLDDRVAELIGLFRARGMLDDTLIIIASDHGEYLDTHRMWDHRYQAYDDVTRAALIVRAPGQTAGRRVSAPVQLSDLYDTVLAVARDKLDDHASFPRNLLHAADGDAPRYAISEYTGPVPSTIARGRARGAPAGDERDHPQYAVHDGRFKFLLSTAGKQELYDVTADPTESTNLIDSHADDAKRLAAHLAAWLERTPKFVPPDTGDDASLDPDVLNALKSLGYAGD